MNNLYAKALVQCGYAKEITTDGITEFLIYKKVKAWYDPKGKLKAVCPFLDTLEGRRQLDALVDYLQIKHDMLWVEGWLDLPVNAEAMSMRERMIATVKWCFEQLEGKE